MAEDDLPERSPHARRNAILVAVAVVLLAVVAWALTRSGGGDQPGGGAPGASGGGRRGGAGGGRGGAGGGSRRPSATVGVAKVVPGDIGETVTAIGTVQPIVVATVRPQLSGNIFTIDFTEGQIVRKGQLLAQIDPRPYRLALAQAQANLARDTATLNLNKADLSRYQTLLAQDSIARQQVQTQAALVKQTEGTVAADRALVGTARLNLQYTSITAPVSGRAGLRQVDIGNYVTPGDTTGVVVITQTTPIDVAFALPQADLQRLLAKMKGGPALPVTARDQAGTATLAEGRFLTFDNQIDATTGTVKAKARFPNPDGKLFPSQFVNVALLADTLRGVATVPVTAIRHGAQGDFVFVLQPDKTVKLTPVTVGPAKGAQVAVTKGVAMGQTVITEGADNLDDGSRVSLPGDRRPQRPKQQGFFARLFGLGGGGGSADNAAAGAGDNAQGGAGAPDGAGGRRRHRRQGNDGGGGGQ